MWVFLGSLWFLREGNYICSWTEEPGRLQPVGLQRVGHNWATKHSTFQLNVQEITGLNSLATLFPNGKKLWVWFLLISICTSSVTRTSLCGPKFSCSNMNSYQCMSLKKKKKLYQTKYDWPRLRAKRLLFFPLIFCFDCI